MSDPAGDSSSAPAAGTGPELKAGHPPATKVGGMRVVQHKQQHKEPEAKMTAEEIEEFGADTTKVSKHSPAEAVLVSGAKASEETAYPAEAVRSFHEKPKPTVENKAHSKPKIIHQPKK